MKPTVKVASGQGVECLVVRCCVVDNVGLGLCGVGQREIRSGGQL